MKRVIVLGGFGLFGRTIVSELKDLGIASQVASRRSEAELRVDANDAASLKSSLESTDLVIDAAGPFHSRSPALIRTAIETGFDVVDINDDLGYAETVLAMASEIDAAGIRVLSSASSVSAIAAAVVEHSATTMPRRITSFLAPASRYTANPGTAASLWRTIGRPVRVLREGQLQTRVGWSETRNFAMPRPVGKIRGHLFESADAIYLPKIWPMLRDVSMYVDANTFGANTLLQMASHSEPLRELAESKIHVGAWLARKFGSSAGGIGYEIEDAEGRISRHAIVAATNSFIAAVAPAVLAAKAISTGEFRQRGLVLPNRHVSPPELFGFLASRGITLSDGV